MTTTPKKKRVNVRALRTLGRLERALTRHVGELAELECKDAVAEAAIDFAIEAAGKALENARAIRDIAKQG